MITNSLQKKLNLNAAIAIVVGSVIGSSIFMKPAVMAQQLPDVKLIILVWMIGGGISYIGAMINAEVGSMFPDTGGQFIYFKKMYGDKFAFLYGWSGLAVINTAAVAAIAFVFAQYITFFITLPHFDESTIQSFYISIPFIGKFYLLENFGVKTIATIIVVLLTFANYISVNAGLRVQNLFTVLKVLLLFGIIIIIFGFGDGDINNLAQSNIASYDYLTILGMVAALSGAFAAFDGWNNIGFVAGEMKEVHKNLPKALFYGLSICMVLYLLTNLAFYYMLPLDVAANSSLIATDAISPIIGNYGTIVIAILVLISTFGAVNGNILACARVTHAMGENKDFFSWTGKVHPKYLSPGNALWLHCLVTCIYIFTGSFDMLADLFVFVTWIFYGFAAYGIFILRIKYPTIDRPYKLKAYPILPILFVTFAFFYSVLTIYNDVSNYMNGSSEIVKSVLGLVIVFSGLVVYRFRNRF